MVEVSNAFNPENILPLVAVGLVVVGIIGTAVAIARTMLFYERLKKKFGKSK